MNNDKILRIHTRIQSDLGIKQDFKFDKLSKILETVNSMLLKHKLVECIRELEILMEWLGLYTEPKYWANKLATPPLSLAELSSSLICLGSEFSHFLPHSKCQNFLGQDFKVFVYLQCTIYKIQLIQLYTNDQV